MFRGKRIDILLIHYLLLHTNILNPDISETLSLGQPLVLGCLPGLGRHIGTLPFGRLHFWAHEPHHRLCTTLPWVESVLLTPLYLGVDAKYLFKIFYFSTRKNYQANNLAPEEVAIKTMKHIELHLCCLYLWITVFYLYYYMFVLFMFKIINMTH